MRKQVFCYRLSRTAIFVKFKILANDISGLTTPLLYGACSFKSPPIFPAIQYLVINNHVYLVNLGYFLSEDAQALSGMACLAGG